MADGQQSRSDSELMGRVSKALAPAYDVEGELGRGGMAIVYRARDARLKRGVAIKLLPPELAYRGDIRSRFLREAETAARLSHPNIVPIYQVDERDGLVYFVMALVEGESLGDRVRRTGPLPIPEARRILREVADALGFASARGVVHRDIKPDNVLLDAATGRAMVTDFGIARAATDGEGRLTATGTAIGTPSYMSPEQCAGDRELDGRSDLYSLGAVAYCMLAGEPPFAGGNTQSIMMKQVMEQPVPLHERRRDVPEDLERVVMRLLEKDPARRFADGGQVVAALDGATIPAMPEAPTQRGVRIGVTGPGLAGLSVSLPTTSDRVDSLLTIAERVRELKSRRRDIVRASRANRHAARWGNNDQRSMAERIASFRRQLVSGVGTTVFLFGINALGPGGHRFWWAAFPALAILVRLGNGLGRLWSDGAKMRDVIGGAPSSQSVAVAGQALPVGAPAPLQPPVEGAGPAAPSGPQADAIRQAAADRKSVGEMLARMSDVERARLPEVGETGEALYARMLALAAALDRLDAEIGTDQRASIDERVRQMEAAGTAADDRRLALLRRQRAALDDLVESRERLDGQFESAGLLLRNLALDLLKVRSSGLQSGALDGVTSVTQEARALAAEIGYVLAAEDELRDLTAFKTKSRDS